MVKQKTVKRILYFLIMIFAVSVGYAGNINAVKKSGTILMDGKLADAAWNGCKEYTVFLKSGTDQASQNKTAVKVLYDDQALYLGIVCHEANTAELRRDVRPRDGGLYALDSVEVMLDPGFSNDKYFHFMVSANGDVFDAICDQGGAIQNSKWNGIWEAKSFIGKGFWSCEIKIPFYNFAKLAKISGDWGINICRNARVIKEDSSIAEEGAYHKTAAFAKLMGLNVDFSSLRFAVNSPEITLKIGEKNDIQAQVNSVIKYGNSDRISVTADAWFISYSGKILFAPKTKFEFGDKEEKRIKLPPVTLPEQGDYRVALRIANSNGRTIAYQESAASVRFTPVSIKLIAPHYRHSIFDTQKLKEIIFDVKIEIDDSALKGKMLELAIKNSDGTVWSEKIKNISKNMTFKVDNAKIPHGRYNLTATLKNTDGRTMEFSTVEVPLWKLPYKKGEVWMGEDGNWYVDGKRFVFHSGWYSSPKKSRPEQACSMPMRSGGVMPGQKWLSPMILFTWQREPGLMSTMQSGSLDDSARKYFVKRIEEDRENQNLFGYYLMDEPSGQSVHPDSLRNAYELIKEADPYHPVIISDSHDNNYIAGADINCHHPYPNISATFKINDLTSIATAYDDGMRKLQGSYHKVSFVFMHMGFSKKDFDLGSKDERIGSYDEFRAQTLMALACGMKGLITYDRVEEAYPECYIGFPALTAESSWLLKAVCAPDAGLKVTVSSPEVRYVIKNTDNGIVLVASNVSIKAKKVRFKIEGLPAAVKSLNVVSEERSVPVENGEFTDDFDVCGGHVYTTGAQPELRSVNAIKAEIEKAWADRRKTGNVLFQRYMDGTVTFKASSATNVYGRAAESCLWHLCDGHIPECDFGYGFLQWTNRADAFPAWVEISLKKPAEIGRIEIYAMEKTVKDLQVEIMSKGKWSKVYENNNVAGNQISCRFTPAVVEKIKINVNAANGKQVKIVEIEAYKN